jgi:hypothetical protein
MRRSWATSELKARLLLGLTSRSGKRAEMVNNAFAAYQ